MLHNKWDLPVSTSSPECVELLDLFVSDFLAYGNRAGKHVTDAVAADPHCALANVFATSLFMFAEMPTAPEKRREFMQQAAKSIADARDANAPVSEREQWWFEAVQAWSQARNLDRAVEMLRRVAAAYPRDIYAVRESITKLAHISDRMMDQLVDLAARSLSINQPIDRSVGEALSEPVLYEGRRTRPTRRDSKRISWCQYS